MWQWLPHWIRAVWVLSGCFKADQGAGGEHSPQATITPMLGAEHGQAHTGIGATQTAEQELPAKQAAVLGCLMVFFPLLRKFLMVSEADNRFPVGSTRLAGLFT